MSVSVASDIVSPCLDVFNSFQWIKLQQHIISISCLNQPGSSQNPGKVLFVFWHCRPEKPIRPLTLNKDTAFSSEGSFTCHTYCDTGPPFLRSYPKDPWFYLLNAVLLAKEQSLPILNVLGLTRPARAGLELTTYCLLSESTTTRLRQPMTLICNPWS